MNAPVIPRAILRHHVATIEARFPLTFVGQLPRDCAAYVEGENRMVFLTAKKDGLNLLTFAQAQVELSDLLGRPVELVLLSGLKGREATELPRLAEPI
ncbi:hypothetical protein [Salinarimonas soli]|uniref:Uncharacterized protein n=1 Tax=Salinarimonas soli TaxID=1638099 RepID=A0A5B2VED6_9HYPH|nr:hypothetical protein [Salinarimonas soli]KAA2237903.1 hypothetical protein F0L46_07880 [Salinarimonas soli]